MGGIAVYRLLSQYRLRRRIAKPFFRSDVPSITPAHKIMPSDSRESVSALAFAPNNDLAAGLMSGRVVMGSAPSSTLFRFIEGATIVVCLAYSPNGQFIAVGTRNRSSLPPEAHPAFLQIRDVESGSVLVEDNTIPEVQNLAWDRDGQVLAVITGGDTMYPYRPFTDGRLHQTVPVSRGASALSFSPTRSELAVSTPNGATSIRSDK